MESEYNKFIVLKINIVIVMRTIIKLEYTRTLLLYHSMIPNRNLLKHIF